MPHSGSPTVIYKSGLEHTAFHKSHKLMLPRAVCSYTVRPHTHSHIIELDIRRVGCSYIPFYLHVYITLK